MSRKLFSYPPRNKCVAGGRVAMDGFSLIEVMVTMVVLAFGMLGVAGLLVGGVSNAASSEAMAKAAQLASGMADRMRANPAVAISATSQYSTGYNDSAPPTPTTVALLDKKVWLESLAAQLPLGDGQIVVDNTNRKVSIQVRWSNCMGVLNNTDQTSCTNNPAAAFKYFNFELRL